MLSQSEHPLFSDVAARSRPQILLADALGCLASLLGILVLIGWTFQIDALKRVSPSFVTMKANTALCFLLTGGALLLGRSPEWRSDLRLKTPRFVLLTVVILLSVLTLSEYAFDVNLDIDELLFLDPEHHDATYAAGRFSPITGLNFLLISVSLLLLDSRSRLSQILAVLAFLISLVAFVGYVYRLQALYGPWSSVSLALHTTVGFLLLSAGVLVVHQDRGLTRLLFNGPGARSNRSFVAGSLLLPLGVGGLILAGYRSNVYGPEFGLALYTIAISLSLTILFWVTAQARYAAEEALQTSERQSRTLANAIPHLAWIADETGHIFWYNRRWYDYTGTTFEKMEGWGWQDVHDPAVLPLVLTAWKKAITSGEPFEMIFPLRGADGHFRSFLTRVEPLRGQDNRVVRWFGTNTDVTEQRQTEEQLRRTNRELEEFAYVASHDLQEPLRMVNIYAQLLLKHLVPHGLEQDTKFVQYAGFIRQGVARMDALIQGLLTFSRTVHTEELVVGRADLSAALQEALFILKERIEETGASVQVQPLPEIRGDTSQMSHVFQNLLSNALKYRHNDRRPEIQITSQSHDAQWVLSLRDNGIGFEPHHAQRIFGLFKRLHKDEYPGTGLGLAICQRIVERYAGKMWAEGRPGDGSTFYLSFPRIEK